MRKGEHAIWIFAPMPLRCCADVEVSDDGHSDPARVLFRAVPVFDRSQVDARDDREPAPLEPPSQPLTGDSHAALLEPAAAFAASLGYDVAYERTPRGVGGWCDHQRRRIVIDTDAPANAQLRIAIHETAHALGIDYQTYTRERAEVMVDTVTYIVCARLGLAIDGESIPYIAGWGEHGALDAVNQFAATIDATARRIETAIRWPEVTV